MPASSLRGLMLAFHSRAGGPSFVNPATGEFEWKSETPTDWLPAAIASLFDVSIIELTP